MPDEPLWSATPSGALAHSAKLRMEDAIRRLKAETHPRQRWGILLEYTVLMSEWLEHIQQHLRQLDTAPPATTAATERVTRVAATP